MSGVSTYPFKTTMIREEGHGNQESEQSEVKVQQINRTDDKKKNHPSSTHTQMRKLFFSQCDKKKCQADE